MAASSSFNLSSPIKIFFSETDLNQMYPNDEWSAMFPGSTSPTTERIKKCVLHFFIAKGVIIDQLYYHSEEQHLYAADDQCYGLTPLMLAVMQGNEPLAKRIMARAKLDGRYKTEIRRQDVFGWTVFHHAAFSCDAIFRSLNSEAAQGEKFPLTELNASPWNVRMLTDVDYSMRIQEQAMFLKNGEETLISKMSSSELSELNLKIYRSSIYYPPSEIQSLWKCKTTIFEDSNGFYNEKMQMLLEGPCPKLVVRECDALKGKIDYPFELVAGEDIPAGCPITLYAGTYCSKNHILSSFKASMTNISSREANKFHPIYPEDIGNVARFSNCGFPNMYLGSVVLHGAPVTLFLSDGIKKGDPIVWNYGAVPYLAFGKMHLFRREEMRDYFKDGMSGIIRKFEEMDTVTMQSKLSIRLQLLHLTRCVTFPLVFTSAMLDLHYCGVIDIRDYYKFLMENRRHRDKFVAFMLFGPGYHLLFCQCVMQLDTRLKDHPEVESVVRKWILDRIGTLSTMQFVKIFQEIKTAVENGTINNPESCQIFLIQQEQKYAEYDWAADVDAPISLEKRITLAIDEARSHTPQAYLSLMKMELAEQGVGREHENYQVYLRLVEHFKTP